MNQLQTLKTLGQRVLSTTRERLVQVRQGLPSVWPLATNTEELAEDVDLEVKEHLSEKSLSTHLLRLSAVAVAFRALQYSLKREWLLAVVSAVSSVLAAPQWIWHSLNDLSGVFVPLLCGVAMTIITWYTVFLDSCIPGIYPPSPVVLKKHGIPYPSTLHLGYIIAMFNGFVLSVLLYFNLNSSSSNLS